MNHFPVFVDKISTGFRHLSVRNTTAKCIYLKSNDDTLTQSCGFITLTDLVLSTVKVQLHYKIRF